MERALEIVGPDSAHAASLRQGVIPHLISVPEGAPALSASQQAARLLKYAQTPHAQTLLGADGIARIRAHAADLLTQTPPARAATVAGREVSRLASEGTPTDIVQKVFAKSGEINAGAEKLLKELHGNLSQPTWNSIRQAMWSHLLEKPEGMVGWGPRELSNRLSRFLSSSAAAEMYSERELAVMRQFQQHFDKLAPLPNTTNPSGSATTAAKLVRGIGRHIFGMLGFAVGGNHLTGLAFGHALDKGAEAVRAARQVAKTKELFLGQKGRHPLSKNAERAAAVVSHAATPLINGPRSG